MKTLIVYDSAFGNTEKIAMAIGEAISGDITIKKASETGPADLESVDLLIAGSPTYGGRATPAMLEFLKTIAKNSIEGLKAASFDTRIPARWVAIFGYAAGRIAGDLKKKGADIIAEPEGFFVEGKEGPLSDEELERAAAWAKEISKNP